MLLNTKTYSARRSARYVPPIETFPRPSSVGHSMPELMMTCLCYLQSGPGAELASRVWPFPWEGSGGGV